MPFWWKKGSSSPASGRRGRGAPSEQGSEYGDAAEEVPDSASESDFYEAEAGAGSRSPSIVGSWASATLPFGGLGLDDADVSPNPRMSSSTAARQRVGNDEAAREGSARMESPLWMNPEGDDALSDRLDEMSSEDERLKKMTKKCKELEVALGAVSAENGVMKETMAEVWELLKAEREAYTSAMSSIKNSLKSSETRRKAPPQQSQAEGAQRPGNRSRARALLGLAGWQARAQQHPQLGQLPNTAQPMSALQGQHPAAPSAKQGGYGSNGLTVGAPNGAQGLLPAPGALKHSAGARNGVNGLNGLNGTSHTLHLNGALPASPDHCSVNGHCGQTGAVQLASVQGALQAVRTPGEAMDRRQGKAQGGMALLWPKGEQGILMPLEEYQQEEKWAHRSCFVGLRVPGFGMGQSQGRKTKRQQRWVVDSSWLDALRMSFTEMASKAEQSSALSEELERAKAEKEQLEETILSFIDSKQRHDDEMTRLVSKLAKLHQGDSPRNATGAPAS